VLRNVRADNNLVKLPVIVVTSSSLESDRVDAMAAGANEYFQKPLALAKFSKDLQSVLNRWLSN
jgi:DNA-binding response OmpR family regulator